MKPLSDFYSRVAPYAPGCPYPTIDQALVDAASAFCEVSGAVTEKLTVTTAVGVPGYALTLPDADLDVARVVRASVGDTPIMLLPKALTPPANTPVGSPARAYVARAAGAPEIHFMPTPDGVYTIDLEAAVKPVPGAQQLHDDLLARWVDAISSGALSRILLIPNQPFTDPKAAGYHAAKARSLTSHARVEASYLQVSGQIRATSRSFA